MIERKKQLLIVPFSGVRNATITVCSVIVFIVLLSSQPQYAVGQKVAEADEFLFFQHPKLLDYNNNNGRVSDTNTDIDASLLITDTNDKDNNNANTSNNDSRHNNKEWIVVLEDNSNSSSSHNIDDNDFGDIYPILSAMTGIYGGRITNRYHHVLRGAVISDIVSVKQLTLFLDDSRIKYITPNSEFSLVNFIGPRDDDEMPGKFVESLPWGLDRIDSQKSVPLNGQYRSRFDGSGVIVYVMEGGIRLTHNEFRSLPPMSASVRRASCGYNYFKDIENCTDERGHGTHVAGIIGGLSYGVAKNVTIQAVKVLDQYATGSYASVIAGLEYVTEQKKLYPGTPMVINMSIGLPKNTALNDAVAKAVAAGIVLVAAAGNTADDACLYSPPSSPVAITVGATNSDDSLAEFSSIGACVNMYAPGSSILSAGIKDDSSVAVKSGTSFSTPHVTGAVALYLERNPKLKPAEILRLLQRDALSGKINGFDDTASSNLLLNIRRLNLSKNLRRR